MHIIAVLYVDPIGIRTSTWRFHVQRVDMNVVAAIEPEMELWAVLDLQPLHCQLGAPEKPYGLKLKKKEKKNLSMYVQNCTLIINIGKRKKLMIS